jgi:beta-glucanase (GH16 family)
VQLLTVLYVPYPCHSLVSHNMQSQKWPYAYDSCDVGTVANQTINGQPTAATVGGDGAGGILSYLPGQRLSRCTCQGESHPGPKHKDGTFVGRSAPEIDVFEAQVGRHNLLI